MKNDLFNRIFLKVCLHAVVTAATYLVLHLLYLFIGGEYFHDVLWVCLFVTNCTALILSKLGRILERLPAPEAQ